MGGLLLQVVLFVNAADVDKDRLHALLGKGIEIEYLGRKVKKGIPTPALRTAFFLFRM